MHIIVKYLGESVMKIVFGRANHPTDLRLKADEGD
jgi:hypothetical protein